jgi:hypothetical protein
MRVGILGRASAASWQNNYECGSDMPKRFANYHLEILV